MTDPDTTRQDLILADDVAQTALDILQDVGPKYWILSDGVQSRVTWEGPDEITLEHTETGHAASFRVALKATQLPAHAGADGSCPDYGSTTDPCPPGCALGTCVAPGQPAPSPDGVTPLDHILRVLEAAREVAVRHDGLGTIFSGPDHRLQTALDALDRALAREAQDHGTGHWEPATWGIVKDGDRVRLNGAEATVTAAVPLNWHTDPASPRWTRPLESATVQVVLEGKNDGQPYTMPPSGPVEVWRESLPDWAAQAFVTLAQGAGAEWDPRPGEVTY